MLPPPSPGSVKSLHLFEARYLSLLDSVLAQPGPNKVCVHAVVESPGDAFGESAAGFPGAYAGDDVVLCLATLVRVRPGSCRAARPGRKRCRRRGGRRRCLPGWRAAAARRPPRAQVVEVKRSFVGALVRVQAEARVAVEGVTQAAPYIVARVAPLPDEPLRAPDEQPLGEQLEALSQAMRVRRLARRAAACGRPRQLRRSAGATRAST